MVVVLGFSHLTPQVLSSGLQNSPSGQGFLQIKTKSLTSATQVGGQNGVQYFSAGFQKNPLGHRGFLQITTFGWTFLIQTSGHVGKHFLSSSFQT
jgi:hypothetical protein